MNFIEALKSLPAERIKKDSEFREAYEILKDVFENGNKDNTNNKGVLSFE